VNSTLVNSFAVMKARAANKAASSCISNSVSWARTAGKCDGRWDWFPGVTGMHSAALEAGDGSAKDNDGLGDREHAGVDVEKVVNASEIKVSRLFEGMA